MRKTCLPAGKTCLILILVFIFLAFVPQVFARHSRVLGDSTEPQIPDLPISEGPGLFLPNSPFYFLDLWRDNLNLLLASFTPETKAKLHLKIAAERIVEVKMMLEAKNVSAPGLDTALANITQNIEGARVIVKTEGNRGKPVAKLASELNQTLDNQQEALRIIAKAGDERIRLKVRAAQEAVKDDEIEIEDELLEDELEIEIERELKQEVEDEVEEASESARRVEFLTQRLNEEASKSAQKALKKKATEKLKEVQQEKD